MNRLPACALAVCLLVTTALGQEGPHVVSITPDIQVIPGSITVSVNLIPTECAYLFYSLGPATVHISHPGIGGQQRIDNPIFFSYVCGYTSFTVDIPDDFDGTFLFVQALVVDMVTNQLTISALAEALLLRVNLTETPAAYLPTDSNTVQYTATIRPAGVTRNITFTLSDVSAFRGHAMNHGAQTTADPDYLIKAADNGGVNVAATELAATTQNAVNAATITVRSFDFGGRAKIRASITNPNAQSAIRQIPKDTDGDWLPDAWETATGLDPNDPDQDLNAVPDGQDDDDPQRPVLANAGPNLLPTSRTGLGLVGDGLTCFEEYRGFFVNGAHARLDPLRKDVFVYADANVNVGIGFFTNLINFNVRQVTQAETAGNATRQINFNNTAIPGSTLQRALHVIRNDALTVLGFARPIPGMGFNQSPNENMSVEVAVILHQRSPSGDDTVSGNTMTTGPDGVADTIAGGDDVQVIPLGRGELNQICVTDGAAANGLQTVPGGDDTMTGAGVNAVIRTGPNGICETARAADDIQVIPVGLGRPNRTMITAGANGVLDTMNGVTAGPDGNFGTADDVQVALTAAQQQDALRESVAHECGHGCHLEHNFALGDRHLIALGQGLANAFGVTTGPDGICQTAAAGDDIQLIPVGRGLPNAICLTAGGGVIVSPVMGDDVLAAAGTMVLTGPDGICDTLAFGADVQVIPQGQGEPNANCVSTGPDGICQSPAGGDDVQRIPVGRGEPNAVAILSLGDGLQLIGGGTAGDDTIVAGNVTTGPDGILQSVSFVSAMNIVSNMTSDVLVPVPTMYSIDDLDQVRFHIKHP